MNIWDILIIAVIALIAGLAIRSTCRKKGGSCNCGCSNCPSRSSCHKERQN